VREIERVSIESYKRCHHNYDPISSFTVTYASQLHMLQGINIIKNDTRHGQAQISCTVDRCRWAVALTEAKTLRDIFILVPIESFVVFGKLVSSCRAMQMAMYVHNI